MLIAVVILGVMAMVGVPAVGEFFANLRVREAAEALRDGLARARAEAIRGRRSVEYVLPLPAAADAGREPPPETAVVATFPLGHPSSGAVRFDANGATGLGGPLVLDVTDPGGGACRTVDAPGPVHCLRVEVSAAGRIRICDRSLEASDPEACR